MEKNRTPKESGLSVRAISVYANPNKVKATQALPQLKSWLKKRGIETLPFGQLSRADALIVLGGDGTILYVAPQAARAGVPVLGINVGHLGFLTVVELKKMYTAIQDWLNGRWTISERLLLEVLVPHEKRPMVALNDVSVRMKASNRVTKIQASINNRILAQFVGDGVIVATSTGSTAYSLSAQGPIVHPSVEALILTPICPHSFAQKPLVFPSHHTLELQTNDREPKKEIQLSLDGQRVFSLREGDRVRIRRSPLKLKLIHDPRVSFFSVLRKKLHWGGR